MKINLWLKNDQGKRSSSLTFTTVAFIAVTAWLFLYLTLKPFGINVPAFDAGVAMTYLTPIMALYFGRRWTESKTEASASKKEGSND